MSPSTPRLICAVLFTLTAILTGVNGDVPNNAMVVCSVRGDCVPVYGERAECRHGWCVCLGEDRTSVVACEPRHFKNLASLVGGACTSDQGCNIDNSMCDLREGKCICMPDYVVTPDNRKCLKVSGGLLQPCEDDVQCTKSVENSRCGENKRCECAPSHHKDKFKCWKNVPLGGGCSGHEECSHVVQGECTAEGVCGCESGLVAAAAGDQCLQTAPGAGSPCREDSQCRKALGPQGACTRDAVCGCRELYTAVDGTCRRDSPLGEVCQSTEDCRNLDGALLMECLGTTCQCADPYIQEEEQCISGAVSPMAAVFLIASLILTQNVL